MKFSEIYAHRLVHQQIATTNFTNATDIVQWLVAIQSQEYAQAKWSIGLRIPGLSDADVEKGFNDGKILRTHILRPTWHFVDPSDIRWMLSISAPRVQAFNAYYYRQWELDAKTLTKANKIITKALEGNNFLTRNELNEHLEKAKIPSGGVRSSGIMMNAELEGVIISGPRKGKQHTYALLEERAKPVKKLTVKEALNELALRYFTSRGPATAQDYAWWSGLTMKDVKDSIEDLPKQFEREIIDGKEYHFLPAEISSIKKQRRTFLMPDYDEYGICYKDRSAIFSEKRHGVKPATNHYFILDGLIEGNWNWTIKGKEVIIETMPFAPLSKAKATELNKAVDHYKKFIGAS